MPGFVEKCSCLPDVKADLDAPDEKEEFAESKAVIPPAKRALFELEPLGVLDPDPDRRIADGPSRQVDHHDGENGKHPV